MKSDYNVCIVLILFCPFILFSQSFDEKEMVNRLWFESDNLIHSGKLEEAIIFNEKLINLCKENDFDKGLVMGYYNIGNALSLMGRYKESILYLNLAEDENKKEKNKELEAIINTAYGNNYLELELHSVSLKYFHKTIIATNKIPLKERRNYLLSFAYGNIGSIYEAAKETDSAYYYRRAAYDEIKDSYNTISLADFFTEYQYNQDSAKHYLKEATEKWGVKMEIHNTYTSYDSHLLHKSWGKYYERDGNYEESFNHYHQSLDEAFGSNILSCILDSYYHLYQVSQKTGDYAKANNYLFKYNEIKDSINSQQKKSLDFSVQKFLDKTENEYKTKRFHFYLIIGGISVAFLTLLYLLFLYLNKKRKVEKQIIKSQIALSEKEKIINQKEQETQELKQKVNESFDEIIGLAKSNSPQFFTRFQEIYPEFTVKLLEIEPKLQTSELTFCAYIFLNFSTKDIANYTFTSPKTVQNRKNHIRKKLQIPSDKDIYIWMKEIMD